LNDEDERVSIEARLVPGRPTLAGISRHLMMLEKPACRKAD
jgi:hypothetical protein